MLLYVLNNKNPIILSVWQKLCETERRELKTKSLTETDYAEIYLTHYLTSKKSMCMVMLHDIGSFSILRCVKKFLNIFPFYEKTLKLGDFNI